MEKPNLSAKWEKLNETCSKHPNSNLVKLPNGSILCPICQNQKLENKKLAFDKEQSQNINRNFLKRYSIIDDKANLKKSFENFNSQQGTKEDELKTEARKIAGIYFKYPTKNFNTIFFGTSGAGKTHLASAIVNVVNEYADPAFKCLMLNTNTMYNQIKASYSNQRHSITKDQVLDLVGQSNLVLLDDLGTESTMRKAKREANEDFQNLLYDILGKCKRLIITTNLSLEELGQVYDIKLISRLRENSTKSILDFSNIEDKRPNLEYYQH